ncbi:MAG: yeaO [Firmicutes bacterium]|nr:yeaO [Bacillota bacterium]
MHKLQIKRIYEEPNPSDGYRILIDRLWPRGISKNEAKVDDWAKSITPSTEIRKEFNHEPARMEVFRVKYIAELDDNPETAKFVDFLAEKLKQTNVTLLYGAKDEKVNHAVILQDWLEEKLQLLEVK